MGSVDAAGEQLADTAIRAGLGSETWVHGVGDGAPWIANQVKCMFGIQAHYLIDFYHLCDYDRCRECPLCANKSPILVSAAKTKTQAQPSFDRVNEFETLSRTRSFA